MNAVQIRTLWLRPVLLSIGGLAAGFIVPGLRPGPLIEILVAVFVVPTALAAVVAQKGFRPLLVLRVSTALGLFGWACFVALTRGAQSPLVFGFLLEIVIVAVSSGVRSVIGTTVGAVCLLLGVGLLPGWRDVALLTFQVPVCLAVGALGATVARRREAGEVALRVQGEELGHRLDALQRALEDERVISRVGENVARLAHGLKNAVHSLRGFVGLIEPELGGGAGSRAALAGLHAAIDDLEKLARLTLGSPDGDEGPVESPRTAAGTGIRLGELVVAARKEVEAASPGVVWAVHATEGAEDREVEVDRETLLELFVILMRNAVEAMSGQGAARVDVDLLGRFARVVVTDEGPGFPVEVLDKIFQPGYTTKSGGSGFGLFLARRIVDDHGGSLEISNVPGGGACVQVALPVAPGD